MLSLFCLWARFKRGPDNGWGVGVIIFFVCEVGTLLAVVHAVTGCA